MVELVDVEMREFLIFLCVIIIGDLFIRFKKEFRIINIIFIDDELFFGKWVLRGFVFFFLVII